MKINKEIFSSASGYISIALLFLSFFSTNTSAYEIERPVIFLPGILGSKLCVNDEGSKLLWGGIGSYSNIDSLKLPLENPEKDSGVVACGIIENIKIVGPFKVHQYDGLVDTLVGLGYERDKTLFLFDYDWRQSNYHTATKFSEFVSEKIPKGEFDIVAHSMGGVVSRIFLKNDPAKTRVNRFIALGTPHRGSVESLKMADSGWSWWKNRLGGGMQNIRESLLTFPSVYQLLPSYKNCCIERLVESPEDYSNIFDPFSIAFWEQIDWLPNFYRSTEGKAFLQAKLEEAEKLHSLLKAEIPGKVEFIPVVSGIIKTLRRAHFDPASGTFVDWRFGNGDGTVYEFSAANGRKINARPSTTEHARIFENDSARQVLRWALVGDIEPTSGGFSSDYRAIVKGETGQVKIVYVGIEVDPPIVKTGGPGSLKVELVGESSLANSFVQRRCRHKA
jgi:hypothetical protein